MQTINKHGVLVSAAMLLGAAPLCAQERRYIEVQQVTHSAPIAQVTEESTLGRPKYHQRIKDLGEQIHLVQGKGFITQPEADKFLERLGELDKMEQAASKDGYPKPASDDLEKGITLLNEQVFKASHKDNPIKPGQAEKEVHDPNLIPAYPDKDLQPGSGKVDPKN